MKIAGAYTEALYNIDRAFQPLSEVKPLPIFHAASCLLQNLGILEAQMATVCVSPILKMTGSPHACTAKLVIISLHMPEGLRCIMYVVQYDL